jgi:pyruvate kinase
MRRSRKVKILATLGPASSDRGTIAELFRAGADMFRINMSHASHDIMRGLVTAVRDVESEHGRPIGILADLQGPKFRIATFASGPVALKRGQEFVIDTDLAPGDSTRVGLPHPEILAAIEPGHRLLLDDGKVRLRVLSSDQHHARTVVEAGTTLSDRKGVSVPDTLIAFSALTAKDRSDLEAALNAGVDWIGLSFIQRPEDLAEVRKVARGHAGVLAKIEKPQAVERLQEIIEHADALMVARGDLGVEMPLERVPGIQKQITRAARRAGKPVVIATQMLESMIYAPVPTRAEVSDVATAVSKAPMRSCSRRVGLRRLSRRVGRDDGPHRRGGGARSNYAHHPRPEDRAGSHGRDAFRRRPADRRDHKPRRHLRCTASGATGIRAARANARRRRSSPSPGDRHAARRLSLVWGLHHHQRDCRDPDHMVDQACRIAFKEGFAGPGQRIIVIAGAPIGTPGSTNMLRVAFVGNDGFTATG